MSVDRRTRTELLEALTGAQVMIADLTKRIPETPRKITHATAAMDMCVDALDQLRKAERESARAVSSYDRQLVSASEVAWVVRALCDRYGIPLGEIVTRCERGHIDDLSSQTVELIRTGVIR